MEHDSPVAELVWAVFSLLLVALLILIFSKRIKLPYTVLLVIVGISLSGLSSIYPDELVILKALEISPDLILYIFLPTLIFDSCYNIDVRSLRHNLVPILTLAIPGLLISTMLIGLIVWLATSIALPTALLLGAILSATDPVSVIALFRQIGAPERLTTLVEGESLFNDATSIVLAKILTGIVLAGFLSGETLNTAVIDFMVLFIGGLLLGFFFGFPTLRFGESIIP